MWQFFKNGQKKSNFFVTIHAPEIFGKLSLDFGTWCSERGEWVSLVIQVITI